MNICKYAGDVSDEFCVNCNGYTINTGNGEVSAEQCGGYEPVEKEVSTIQSIPETKTVDELSSENKNKEVCEAVQLNEKVEVDKLPTQEPKFNSKAITKEITISSSVSKEILGSWYKLTYQETIILPEDAEVEKERERLWNLCNDEVDKQIANITN